MDGETHVGSFSLGVAGLVFDFNFVPVEDELRRETKRFALQCLVDEGDGLIHLSGGGTVGELAGIKLKFEPADDDGFHAGSWARIQSAVFMVLISVWVMMAAPPP